MGARRSKLVALIGFLLVGPALARPEANASAKWIREGERLYQAGQYREAAEALLRAEALEPNPRLIYNIARAYDQAGELVTALRYYQEYVGSREGADPSLLKKSALSIDRLRRLINERDQLRAQSDEARKKQEEQLREAKQRAEEQSAAKERAEQERRAALIEARRGHDRGKIEAYVAGGAGVLGLAAGVTFGVMALSSYGQFKAAPDLASKGTLRSQTQGQALAADIGYGVAIAAAAVAIILYPKGPPPAGNVELMLTPSRSGAMAGIGVSF